jgi:hypothetical protein
MPKSSSALFRNTFFEPDQRKTPNPNIPGSESQNTADKPHHFLTLCIYLYLYSYCTSYQGGTHPTHTPSQIDR